MALNLDKVKHVKPTLRREIRVVNGVGGWLRRMGVRDIFVPSAPLGS